MEKAYKFRIYPNKEQEILIQKTFGSCRFVYNHYLAKKINLYKTENKSLSKIDCNNSCNRELKKEYLWLKEVDKFALTNSIYDLDTAYQNFFRRIKQGSDKAGFPHFKSKHDHYHSYKTNFTNNNIKVDFENDRVQLPKLKQLQLSNAEIKIPESMAITDTYLYSSAKAIKTPQIGDTRQIFTVLEAQGQQATLFCLC